MSTREIGRYTENEMEQYSKRCDDFEDLLKAFWEEGLMTESKGETELRDSLIEDALVRKAGLSNLEERLMQNKLRTLYVRDPLELVLHFCFTCNETEGAKKYGRREFARLWNRLTDKYEFPDYPNPIEIIKTGKEEGKGSKSIITLQSLKTYIQEASKKETQEEKDNVAATAEVTITVERDIAGIDVTSADAEKYLEKVFLDHMDKLSSASQSIRYYVAKYIYYIVCHQIMELKDVLKEFSLNTSQKVFNDYINDETCYPGWSIKKAMRNYINKAILDDGKKVAKKVAKKNKNEGAKEYVNLIESKELLKALLSAFVLQGSPTSHDGLSILLRGKEGKPESWELPKTLGEATSIFANARKKALHEEYVAAIENLSISEFLSYGINLQKVYELLFERIQDKDVNGNAVSRVHNTGSTFLRSILVGEYNMSRSALLMLLASAKGVLFHEQWLLETEESLYTENDYLGVDRVNHILNRVGYVDLGDLDADAWLDNIEDLYYKVFSEENSNMLLNYMQEEMNNYAVAYGIYLPFVIMKKKASEASQKLSEELNRGM